MPHRLSSVLKSCGLSVDTVIVTLPLTIKETLNGSHRCPSECRGHCGGDSVALGTL